jgi:hypothetical protein
MNKLKILFVSVCCVFTIISQAKTMDSAREENLKNSQIHAVYQKSTAIEMPSKGLTDENICVLSKHIEGNNVLVRINLNHNNFGDEGLLALANILPTLSSLVELHLYDAKSDGTGALAIINAARQMIKLTSVDVRTIINTHENILLCADKKFQTTFVNLPNNEIIKSLILASYDNSSGTTPF